MGRGLTVITPTLAERAEMFQELAQDLYRQTVRFDWRWCRDDLALGPAILRNVMALESSTEWIAFIDDDDRVDPEHLATLLDHSDDADVVYSLGRVEGRAWEIPHSCDLETLSAYNSIPVTSLVRRDAFLAAGGFPRGTEEDWGLWRTMKAQGARFRCVHETTWTYRFHRVGHGNRTFSHG